MKLWNYDFATHCGKNVVISVEYWHCRFNFRTKSRWAVFLNPTPRLCSTNVVVGCHSFKWCGMSIVLPGFSSYCWSSMVPMYQSTLLLHAVQKGFSYTYFQISKTVLKRCCVHRNAGSAIISMLFRILDWTWTLQARNQVSIFWTTGKFFYTIFVHCLTTKQ